MIKRMQQMPVAGIKTRDADGNPIIEGYFAVFGTRYEEYPGEFEELMPGCFKKSINENDIRALVNHDSTQVLGRNKAGTLELREDGVGLFGRILINPNDTDAMNLHARIERGDVTQASFGFFIRAKETEFLPDGTILNRITDADLLEISPCTFPAYPDTHLTARENPNISNKNDDAHEKWRADMLERLKNRNAGGTKDAKSIDASQED